MKCNGQHGRIIIKAPLFVCLRRVYERAAVRAIVCARCPGYAGRVLARLASGGKQESKPARVPAQ